MVTIPIIKKCFALKSVTFGMVYIHIPQNFILTGDNVQDDIDEEIYIWMDANLYREDDDDVCFVRDVEH